MESKETIITFIKAKYGENADVERISDEIVSEVSDRVMDAMSEGSLAILKDLVERGANEQEIQAIIKESGVDYNQIIAEVIKEKEG